MEQNNPMTYVVMHRKNGLRSFAVCVLAQPVCVPVNASTITYDGQDLGDSTAIHLDASDVGGEPGPLDFRFGPALGIGWISIPGSTGHDFSWSQRRPVLYDVDRSTGY